MTPRIDENRDLRSKIACLATSLRRNLVAATIGVSCLLLAGSAHAQSVTLSTTSQQTFTGFGGAIADIAGYWDEGPDANTQAQFNADTFKNLNLSYVRMSIDPAFEAT